MLVIPAIDLHQGNCVRLTQGKLDKETIYSTDPVFMAKLWQARGAKRLHLVDLDGAYCGKVQHWEIIKKIREGISIPIEFGGGVRNYETVEKLSSLGIDKIIMSTIIVNNLPEAKKIISKFKDKIMVAVDYEGENIYIGGWKEKTPILAKDFLKEVESLEIKDIIITDISREGLLEGVELKNTENLIKNTKLNVIISGGVTTLEDIKKIKQLEKYGVLGVIVGKALYAEKFTLEEATKIAEN